MIDRARLRALAEAATPGPWYVGALDRHGQRIVRSDHIEIASFWHHCVGAIEKEMESNSRFTAAAREAIPALLDALDAAERERDSLRAVHDDMRGTILRFKAERDALAAMLREARDGIDDHWRTTPEGAAVMVRIDAALAAREQT